MEKDEGGRKKSEGSGNGKSVEVELEGKGRIYLMLHRKWQLIGLAPQDRKNG